MNISPSPITAVSDVNGLIDQELSAIAANRQARQAALDAAHAAEVSATADISYDAGVTDTLMKVKTYLASLTVAPAGGDQGGISTGSGTQPTGSTPIGTTVAPGITQNPDGTFQNASGQPTDANGTPL